MPDLEYIGEDRYTFNNVVFSPGGRSAGHDDSRFYRGFHLMNYCYDGGRDIYLPDVMATMAHENRTKYRKNAKEALKFVKSALIDQDLPASCLLETWDEMGGVEYLVYLQEFGRSAILRMIDELKYQDAFPEVREAMMHDSDSGFRLDALEVTSRLGGRRAASALCEKLLDRDERMHTRMLAGKELSGFSYPESMSALREAYLETEYMRPRDNIDGISVYMGLWMPAVCLAALSRITTPEALEVIERGIDGPFRETEFWGRKSLGRWIRNSASRLARQPYGPRTEERIEFLQRLVIKHGLDDMKSLKADVKWQYGLANPASGWKPCLEPLKNETKVSPGGVIVGV